MTRKIWMGAVLCAVTMGILIGCSSSADKSNREGMEKYQAGDYMEASRLFGQAISQDNEEPEYYVNQGMAHIQLHQCEEAKERIGSGVCHGLSRDGTGLSGDRKLYGID